jgi:hypothetical protein
MSAEYQAVIYENKAEEPLLSKEEQCVSSPTTTHIAADVLARFKSSSFILGIIVGFFIQFSTLGANYLALSFMGEAILNVTQWDLIIFSLVWSLITSTMAIIILAFLRKLLYAMYMDQDIEDMVLHMECRYVVGALIGVCTAWAATDVALGLSGQVVYSVVTLISALSWCRLMMYFFASGEDYFDDDDDEESDDILIV